MSIPGLTRWLPLVLYSGLIFYVSSTRPPELMGDEVPGGDKLLHVGAYLVWALLCGWALARSCPRLPGSRFIAIVTVAGALYGVTDEFHQSFVPGRTADALDLLADAIGALLGALLARFWLRPKRDAGTLRAPGE